MTLSPLIFLVVLLSGCQTVVPVSKPFPDVPASLMEAPKQMVPISDKDIKLSTFLGRVIDNSSNCLENEIKLRAWQSWYEQQRILFEK